jgi:hypothetical protein
MSLPVAFITFLTLELFSILTLLLVNRVDIWF